MADAAFTPNHALPYYATPPAGAEGVAGQVPQKVQALRGSVIADVTQYDTLANVGVRRCEVADVDVWKVRLLSKVCEKHEPERGQSMNQSRA